VFSRIKETAFWSESTTVSSIALRIGLLEVSLLEAVSPRIGSRRITVSTILRTCIVLTASNYSEWESESERIINPRGSEEEGKIGAGQT
jgi:hypothetical protein